MAYMTDRKRAEGLGSAKAGTEHFWGMIVSSVGLAILTPLFVFTFGPLLGAPYEEVRATLSRPFPAVVVALMLIAGWLHFKNGTRTLFEDYSRGTARIAWIIGTTCLAYGALAAGLVALAGLVL